MFACTSPDPSPQFSFTGMDGTSNIRRSYSDEERANARRLYVEVGPAEAGRRLGIPAATIRKWAERSDLTSKHERAGTVAAAVDPLASHGRSDGPT